MVSLRLPRLPKTDTVRLTITLPADLHDRLELYADLYAETYGERIDVKRLLPYMLEPFLASDRAFARKSARSSKPAGKAGVPIDPARSG